MRAGRVAVVLALGALPLGCRGSAEPRVPVVDPASVESQVAEKIARTSAAVRDDPRSPGSWGKLGQVLQAHELQLPALECYERAMALDPTDYRWPYLAALTRWKDDLAVSLGHFERALRLGPDNPAFHLNYADTLLRAGRPADAADRYRFVLERTPRSIHALVGLARVALLEGDVAEARTRLDEAAAVAPDGAEVHSLLAQVHLREGNRQAAEREASLARRGAGTPAPPDPVADVMLAEAIGSHALARRAVALADEGRLDQAEAVLHELIRLRPDDAKGYVNLGNVLIRRRAFERAASALESALRLEPDNVNALNNLAVARMNLGDLEGAEARIEEAIRLDPLVPGSHYNLGLVREKLGEPRDAISAYREALRLEPGYGEVHTRVGIVLASVRRIDEAVEHWRRALDIDPRDGQARFHWSATEIARGHHERAMELLREGVELTPDDMRLVSLLAWELASAPDASREDAGRALDLAQRVYGAAPTVAESADLLAAALAANGRFDEATRIAEKGLATARQAGRTDLETEMAERLRRYRRGEPHRR